MQGAIVFSSRVRNLVWAVILGGLTAGCTTKSFVAKEEMVPGGSLSKSRVQMVDGFEYRFDRVEFVPDSLIGEYSVPVERNDGQGEIYIDDVKRQQSLALSKVREISVSQRDPSKTVLYGAGIAAIGFLIRDLTSVADPKPRGGSRTKPNPG